MDESGNVFFSYSEFRMRSGDIFKLCCIYDES